MFKFKRSPSKITIWLSNDYKRFHDLTIALGSQLKKLALTLNGSGKKCYLI